MSGPRNRATQDTVLHVGCPWSRECRHLDSHRHEQRHTPAHAAVRLPTGSAAVLPGCQVRVAAILRGPGEDLGADRLTRAILTPRDLFGQAMAASGLGCAHR